MWEKTVPCKFCGDPTPMTATKLCNSCWELDHRIDAFIKHKKARKFLFYKINKFLEDNKLKE